MAGLQRALDVFREGWDNHPLRTENNMTPNQLREVGQLQHPIADPEVLVFFLSIEMCNITQPFRCPLSVH